jgi:hypothetical protein
MAQDAQGVDGAHNDARIGQQVIVHISKDAVQDAAELRGATVPFSHFKLCARASGTIAQFVTPYQTSLNLLCIR